MKSPSRRLTIPARRIPSREELRPVMPFFLRDLGAEPSLAGPPLLCFASDGFVDDFLAVAGQRRALPKTLPWRDWSEPPGAMLNPSGIPDYPASITRAAPFAFVPEAVGAGIDPDGIPSGTPNWLRKLYLPLHERFTLVAFDLVCRAAGWPRLDRPRVLEAGAVIRRLVPDPAAERWQDWIGIDDKQGLWVELFDGAMVPLAGGGGGVDPVSLPESALSAHEARLRALRDLPLAAPLMVGLTSQPLSLVPSDVGDAARHCTLYGYLPVFSAAREVPLEVQGTSGAAQIAAALAAQTRTNLQDIFTHAAGLVTAARPHLGVLLRQALLPTRPTATQVNNARTAVTSYVDGVFAPPAQFENAIAQGVDRILLHVLRRLLDHDASAALRDAQVAGAVPTGQVFWTDSGAPAAPGAPGLASGWLRNNMLDRGAHWDTLVRERLHQVCDGWLATGVVPAPSAGNSTVLGQRELWTVVLLANLRLRGVRLALAAYLSTAVGWGDASARLKMSDPDGNPVSTAGGLAEEIDAILDLEAERGDSRTQLPWPPLSFVGLNDSARLLAVHRAGAELARVYAGFDLELSAAGGAAQQQWVVQARGVADQIDTVLGLPSGFSPLRERGADLLEQPARGLLVLPGYAVDTAMLGAFSDAAAGRYLPAPHTLALTEARDRDRATRLRFDGDHLYAVWCWVRVAGRDPCEPERILWTPRGEPFAIAEPTDLLGARPASIKMPDIPKLLRDLPRLAKARANPFAAVASPDRSGLVTGPDMADTRRDWGIGFICSFGIPVITICALVLFNIIFHILIVLPGFAWMLLLKFCIPFPRRGS